MQQRDTLFYSVVRFYKVSFEKPVRFVEIPRGTAVAFGVLPMFRPSLCRTMVGSLVTIASPPRRREPIHVKGLVQELRHRTRGEVRFDDGSRALYSTDASNYRQTPIGVVIPKDAEDVVQTVASCRKFGVPILSRGGGTSLAGQCCNAAVVMDMSKHMNAIVELNPESKLARVQPGLILDDLRDKAEESRLTFGPDPATHNRCTLGGMIGNNACGVHSVMAGKTSDNVEELEILTYDGLRMRVGRTPEEDLERIIASGGRMASIYQKLRDLRDRYADQIRRRFTRIPRRISGYNLDELLPENGFHVARALVGSESTCVTVLEATVRLVYSPPFRTLVVLGYSDVYTGADRIMDLLARKPIALEGLDHRMAEDMRKKSFHPEALDLLPEGGGWLIVEFGGETRAEANGRARDLAEETGKASQAPSTRILDDPAQQKLIWEIREAGFAITARVPGQSDAWPGWDDSAVPPQFLGDYLRDLRRLLEKYGYNCSFYGHLGDGCIHTLIDFDLKTKEGIAHYRAFVEEAADTVVHYGGSLSGEHGDGQALGELLPRMFGQELSQAFREFKMIWDPNWKMNPGKIVNPRALDQDLRFGTHYNPPAVETHFHFGDDEGSFARAAERCIGVGECRKLEHGTMCPSYMVTREEQHSTRGRARLLFEMLEGDPLRGGWRDKHVREALDLCLSCKACKAECPINVDMATYKAEFLSHYYAGRLRPRSAYAAGLVYWWSRAASLAPGAANFLTHAPGFRDVAKRVAGFAPQREIPAFAEESFQKWFARRGVRNAGQTRVLLWPDTFDNYFQPEVAKAAVDVLEAAGYQVGVPARRVCCGRPLYDYGMLGLARRALRNTLKALWREIEDGVPIIGLEPSCVAVFRDELTDLLHGDEEARRLRRQTFLLSEFLEQKAKHYEIPKLARQALVHGHCHHKAILKMTDEEAVLSKMGLDYRVLDSGCCGMAGGFGYEKAHYDVSIKCGERALLPAVREASSDTLVIADGFSCREQIAQSTGRRALHLAQALQMAMREGPNGPAGSLPEMRYAAPDRSAALNGPGKAVLVGAGALLAGGVLVWGLNWMQQRRRQQHGKNRG
jgi:FAD/FMN-containing dehydrogenase/Fe-S oxidoreductase